jgi:hypothetical protein
MLATKISEEYKAENSEKGRERCEFFGTLCEDLD